MIRDIRPRSGSTSRATLKQTLKTASARPRLEQEDSEVWRNAHRSGWLYKNKKKFWFIVDNAILYWSKKKIQATADNFAKNLKGQQPLAGACVTLLNSKNFELVTKGGSHLVLVSDTGEAPDWVDSINVALKQAGEKSGGRIEKHGQLFKQGKKLFVMLKADMLAWFKDVHDETPLGTVKLRGCSITNPTADSLMIIASDLQEYEFKHKDPTAVVQWTRRIRKIIAQNDDAGAHDDEDDIGDEDIGVVDAHSRSSWVTYGGRRIFMVLRASTLLFFDSEVESSKLSNSRKNLQLDKGFQTMVDAWDTKTVVLMPAQGKSMKIVCDDSQGANDWSAAINAAVEMAEEDATARRNSPRIREFSGYLSKPGGKRWFVLTKHALYWYTKESDEKLRKDKGCFPLLGLVTKRDEKNLELTDRIGRTRVLTAKTVEDASAWQEALTQAIAALSEETQSTRIFGVSLSAIAERIDNVHELLRDGMIVRPGAILAVLDEPLRFLTRYGGDTAKLFLVMAEKNEIERYREALDRGIQVVFPPRSDKHVAAGVIMRWLSLLPEPLLGTGPILQNFLKCNSRNVLAVRECVTMLPYVNKVILHRLCKFLNKLTQYGVGYDDDSQVLELCWRFSHNFIRKPNREKLTDYERQQSVNVAWMLITGFKKIFDGELDTCPVFIWEEEDISPEVVISLPRSAVASSNEMVEATKLVEEMEKMKNGSALSTSMEASYFGANDQPTENGASPPPPLPPPNAAQHLLLSGNTPALPPMPGDDAGVSTLRASRGAPELPSNFLPPPPPVPAADFGALPGLPPPPDSLPPPPANLPPPPPMMGDFDASRTVSPPPPGAGLARPRSAGSSLGPPTLRKPPPITPADPGDSPDRQRKIAEGPPEHTLRRPKRDDANRGSKILLNALDSAAPEAPAAPPAPAFKSHRKSGGSFITGSEMMKSSRKRSGLGMASVSANVDAGFCQKCNLRPSEARVEVKGVMMHLCVECQLAQNVKNEEFHVSKTARAEQFQTVLLARVRVTDQFNQEYRKTYGVHRNDTVTDLIMSVREHIPNASGIRLWYKSTSGTVEPLQEYDVIADYVGSPDYAEFILA